MPTYEYRCDCGEEFEEFQSISADPVADCPVCGKPAQRQISGGAGLIFKGSGFYITDYKNGKSSAAEAASATSSESKSETKTEATAGAKSDGATASSSASGKSESSGASKKNADKVKAA